MAVPFGFSAGDFVSGLGLLKKAIEALRDTDGASSQFQSTILELESLVTVLQKTQGFQATDATSDTVERIRYLGHLCSLPLQAFLARLTKLEPELGNGATFAVGKSSTTAHGPLNKYGKRPFRQVQWAIQLKKHVSELKLAIGPQLEAIIILLQLVSCERQALLLEDFPKFALSIESLQDSIRTHDHNLTTSMKNMAAGISADINHQISEHLSTRLDCLTREISSKVNDLKITSFTQHDNALSELEITKRMALRQEQATLAPRPDTQIVRVPKRGVITKDTTVGEIIELLQEGVQLLFLRFWILMSFMRTVAQYTTFIARLPTALLSDNIRYVDSMGRVASLPYEHFRHYPVFLARLKIDVQGTPFECLFRRRFYAVLDARTHRILGTREDWLNYVEPRSHVVIFPFFPVWRNWENNLLDDRLEDVSSIWEKLLLRDLSGKNRESGETFWSRADVLSIYITLLRAELSPLEQARARSVAQCVTKLILNNFD